MACNKTWKRNAGVVMKASVAEKKNVLTFSGRLLVTNHDDPDDSPPTKVYDRAALEKGVRVTLRERHTYRLTAIVVARRPTETSVVHVEVAFDETPALASDCNCTADVPMIEWRVTVP